MANTFGRVFRITTFGESHGGGVGVVIDGCPPGLPLDASVIQADLDRRRPGQSAMVTQRRESDTIQILSGVFNGQTLGTPIALLAHNTDAISESYDSFRHLYRPSHADYTYDAKYGVRDWRGGGRSSARETLARVAAGAVARALLATVGVEVIGWVQSVHDIDARIEMDSLTRDMVEATPTRCPDAHAAEIIARKIETARSEGNSLGGIVGCLARGVPPGWGDPVFGKLEAELGAGILSIPAVKGFEVGSGFAGTRMTGLEHNDPFIRSADGRITTAANRSGGIQGGISNGQIVWMRAAVKPTATIAAEQRTVSQRGVEAIIRGTGRHDPCVLPRAVPVVEAMVCLVLADCWLRQQSIRPEPYPFTPRGVIEPTASEEEES